MKKLLFLLMLPLSLLAVEPTRTFHYQGKSYTIPELYYREAVAGAEKANADSAEKMIRLIKESIDRLVLFGYSEEEAKATNLLALITSYNMAIGKYLEWTELGIYAPIIRSEAEHAALPVGTHYKDESGKMGIKQ